MLVQAETLAASSMLVLASQVLATVAPGATVSLGPGGQRWQCMTPRCMPMLGAMVQVSLVHVGWNGAESLETRMELERNAVAEG